MVLVGDGLPVIRRGGRSGRASEMNQRSDPGVRTNLDRAIRTLTSSIGSEQR